MHDSRGPSAAVERLLAIENSPALHLWVVPFLKALLAPQSSARHPCNKDPNSDPDLENYPSRTLLNCPVGTLLATLMKTL